jgi:hypothetical protein
LKTAKITTQTHYDNSKREKTEKWKKKKDWWCDELERLNKQIKESYREMKRTNVMKIQNKIEYKNKKNEFRKLQRKRQYEIKNETPRMLNELLKLNKRNFWRTIKRKRKKSVNTTLPISEIKKEFEELFNTLSEMKTEKDEKIENKTKERYENIKNTHIVE